VAYHTIDDLKSAVPPDTLLALVDDAGVGDFGDDAMKIINDTIAGTEALIDSYLAPFYQTPVIPVPTEIRDYACDITLYKLYKRVQEQLSETRRAAYKDAIQYLKDIRDGKQTLPSVISSSGFSSGVVVSRENIIPPRMRRGWYGEC
jgi:phage gp36-like protein